MKISIEEHGYTFSAEWKEDEYDTYRPDAEEFVDKLLYLATKVYNKDEIVKFANKWEL